MSTEIEFKGGWEPDSDFLQEYGVERAHEIAEDIDAIMTSLTFTADDRRGRVTGGVLYLEIDGDEFEVPFGLEE